jgi:hypothetical protein
MINLGEGVDKDTLGAFRNYWTAEVEGQGKVPITGMKGGDVMRLHPEGDNALYLKYQEFLKSEIATAFDLSPQNLGIERDVNRSTGEVSQERDWDQAIKPRAKELAAYLTRHALHRRLGFWQLQFRFLGLDREDEKRSAEVFALEYKANAITPNEYRESRGRPPLDTPFSGLTSIEAEIARAAATGSKRVLDPAVPDDKPSPSQRRRRDQGLTMAKDLHTVAVSSKGDGPAQEDRLIVLMKKGLANAAGGSAGAAVTIALTGLELPASYGVQVTPSQDATVWTSGRSQTGFTINLAPRLAANTLAAGTVDVLVFA